MSCQIHIKDKPLVVWAPSNIIYERYGRNLGGQEEDIPHFL